MPHFGLAVTVEQFEAIAARVRGAGIKFIIEARCSSSSSSRTRIASRPVEGGPLIRAGLASSSCAHARARSPRPLHLCASSPVFLRPSPPQPTLRFEGAPGEQYTMFFKDPSGNNLEFKAMTTPENLFAKYNVA